VATRTARVFVGISLRNKTLSEATCMEILRLARSEFDASHVVFLVADEIELINLRMLSNGSSDVLARKVEEQAASMEQVIQHSLRNAPHMIRGTITISRWRSIQNAGYWSVYAEVWSLFVDNVEFRRAVEDIASTFAGAQLRQAGTARVRFLSHYVLAELPTLLRGVQIRGRSYLGMIYPSRGGEAIDVLAEQISAGRYGNLPACRKICRVVRLPL